MSLSNWWMVQKMSEKIKEKLKKNRRRRQKQQQLSSGYNKRTLFIGTCLPISCASHKQITVTKHIKISWIYFKRVAHTQFIIYIHVSSKLRFFIRTFPSFVWLESTRMWQHWNFLWFFFYFHFCVEIQICN